MKKKALIKNLAIILLFFFHILLYLWIYIFPAVKKVNMIKREIKEYTLKIENAENEKSVFAKGDKRENLLFAECNAEFSKRLEKWKNEKITFKNSLKMDGSKAGVSRLTISSEPDETIPAVTSDREGISRNYIHLDFIGGLRYGAEFIRALPFSGQYLLINRISALRSGAYYHFNVNTLHLYTGKVVADKGMSPNDKKGNLIDMNSPLLKRPVYLSPLKIKKRGTQ